jgi:GNAT superfamily N-acetyltransferase
MEIRDATEADIPTIVALLKLSLGESLMPKSERYWRWKHVENPFGPSPVLLCWEGSDLVGVRAFMRWEWINQGQVYRGVRAVDTATHPDYQGKGIFKKLTLSLVNHCKERGYDFVFNTPNQQSKPGYLKMGWEEAGRLPVEFSIRKPFNMARNFVFKDDPQSAEKENPGIKHYFDHPGVPALMVKYASQANKTVTNFSKPYLVWRYHNVPVVNYIALGNEQGEELRGLLIGRIKRTRLGRELRITDSFLQEGDSRKEWMKKLQRLKKEWDVDYCTLSATLGKYSDVLGRFRLRAPLGPIVTVRALSLESLSSLISFKNWAPSLGDLELF